MNFHIFISAVTLFAALQSFTVEGSFRCMQCGGKLFEGDVRISRHHCCNPTPVVCSKGQVCLRAYVLAPETTFFLSGCHRPEDGLIGCDQHGIQGNATVHRCTCMDERCQSFFPGNCHKPTTTSHPITHRTTIASPTSTISSATSHIPSISLLHPPRNQPRKGREDVNSSHIVHSRLFSCVLSVLIIVFLS